MKTKKSVQSKTRRGVLPKSWQWENLTSPDFASAVKETRGVCIVPIGCLERHGGHLPLGTDTLLAEAFVKEAVKIERAVVFPPLFLGWIHEAKHHPGAVALSSRLLLKMLEEICEEIARNGFKKIIIMSYHGGNNIGSFAGLMLEEPHDYTLYCLSLASVYPVGDATWQSMRTIENDGHAGDDESSELMAVHPQLVKLDAITKPGRPLGRLAHLACLNIGTPFGWYADYPGQYSGDARNADIKKGRYLFDYAVKRLAKIIGVIKKDRVVPALEKEFFSRIRHRNR